MVAPFLRFRKLANMKQNAARVVQISVSPQGGVPKLPIEEAQILINGVAGDKQRERRFHGGPMRAVCLYSYERILELQDEGHPIDCGTTGENLTVCGLDWDEIKPGVQLQIGSEVQLEITSYTKPCFKIASCFVDGKFERIWQRRHAGWSRLYAKVLCEGTVRQGDDVRQIES